MPTEGNIQQAGEKIVIDWLTQNGYKMNPHSKFSHLGYIEATGKERVLLVLVKSAVHPAKPGSLLDTEVRGVLFHAHNYGYSPYEARVEIDKNLKLIGTIKWRHL